MFYNEFRYFSINSRYTDEHTSSNFDLNAAERLSTFHEIILAPILRLAYNYHQTLLQKGSGILRIFASVS